jgi:hypothetical protein
LALASWTNAFFQDSNPAGPLPHWAAFAWGPEQARRAMAMIARRITIMITLFLVKRCECNN